ncbi:MAG: efflux RND transporter permease subunit, partial [Mucispirillum sp.]|nr:efflux RND transporter permease subunit [Mucispirillum sp.]
LIVYQTINNVKEGMSGNTAISSALKTRIRPIFMSSATSIFGMLPLVFAPGEGSELYRGMGSVILGGMTISTIFTLFLIPALLSLFLSGVKGKENVTSPA